MGISTNPHEDAPQKLASKFIQTRTKRPGSTTKVQSNTEFSQQEEQKSQQENELQAHVDARDIPQVGRTHGHVHGLKMQASFDDSSIQLESEKSNLEAKNVIEVSVEDWTKLQTQMKQMKTTIRQQDQMLSNVNAVIETKVKEQVTERLQDFDRSSRTRASSHEKKLSLFTKFFRKSDEKPASRLSAQGTNLLHVPNSDLHACDKNTLVDVIQVLKAHIYIQETQLDQAKTMLSETLDTLELSS